MSGILSPLMCTGGFNKPVLPAGSWEADNAGSANTTILLDGPGNMVSYYADGFGTNNLGKWIAAPYNYKIYEARLSVISAGTSGWTNTGTWYDLSTTPTPSWAGLAVGSNTVATVRLEIRVKTVTSISGSYDYIVFFVIS